MKKKLEDLLEQTQTKPDLIDLFKKSMSEISHDDLLDDDNSLEGIREQNDTFYMRVIYLFLDYAGKYYYLHEIKDWLASEILNDEEPEPIEEYEIEY